MFSFILTGCQRRCQDGSAESCRMSGLVWGPRELSRGCEFEANFRKCNVDVWD